MVESYFYESDKPDSMAAIGVDSSNEFHVLEIWKEKLDGNTVRAFCCKIVENVVPMIPATAFLIGNVSPEKCCPSCLPMMALIVEQNLGEATRLSHLAYANATAKSEPEILRREDDWI